jgi:hypothetical protein
MGLDRHQEIILARQSIDEETCRLQDKLFTAGGGKRRSDLPRLIPNSFYPFKLAPLQWVPRPACCRLKVWSAPTLAWAAVEASLP